MCIESTTMKCVVGWCNLLKCALALQGYAYVEFLEPDAVSAAVALTDTEIHARKIKVCSIRIYPYWSRIVGNFDLCAQNCVANIYCSVFVCNQLE